MLIVRLGLPVVLLWALRAGPGRACRLPRADFRRHSLGERAERADVLLLAEVLAVDPPDPEGAYAAHVRVLEVSKGRRSLENVSKFPDEAEVRVAGFGPPTSCRSQVHPGRVYLMMLSTVDALAADYSDGAGAVQEYSPRDYDVVRRALGWKRWSPWGRCSRTCGRDGVKERSRTCTVPPCSYGTTRQVVACSRWPCPDAVDVLSCVPAKDRQKRSLEVRGADVLPRGANASGLSISYRLTRRPRAGADLLSVHRSADGATLLAVRHVGSTVRVSVGAQTAQVTAAANASSHSVFLHLNASHLSVFADCRRVVLPLHGDHSWPLLPPSNLTVFFDELLKDLVDFFVIAAQPFQQPPECFSESDTSVVQTPLWRRWTICSVSCGVGTKQRSLYCEDGTEDCLRWVVERHQVRKCEMQPCPPIAGTFIRTGSGDSQSPPYVPATIDQVFRDRCEVICHNGGRCVDGRCKCARGYQGNGCQYPVCSPRCRHDGVCVRPDRCVCPIGYRGPTCAIPVCPMGCLNGGQCVARGKCACPMGFRGRRCQQAICLTRCQNGGQCLYPNLCSCKYGTYGQYCEKFECYPNCINGGRCVAANKCKCKRGFYGKYCHRVRCRHLCLNGGRCTRHGICKCPRGFYGPRCASKHCVRELKYKHVYKPTIKTFYETVVRLCRRRRLKYCREKRPRSVVVHRIIMKPYFTCNVT